MSTITAAEWKDATAGLSPPRAIAGHAAYHQIMALGPPALPLIFRDLGERRMGGIPHCAF